MSTVSGVTSTIAFLNVTIARFLPTATTSRADANP
jgi:hypothetical protein